MYGYGTTDPLEEVLAPGYFGHGGGLLRPGDLIYVSMCPPEMRGGAAPGEPRMALAMKIHDHHDLPELDHRSAPSRRRGQHR